MPRFYEEAAHLLLIIVSGGLVIAPDTDTRSILYRLAVRLEGILAHPPTHADAAIAVLDELAASGMASFASCRRQRLIALAGTMIGNLLTIQATAVER